MLLFENKKQKLLNILKFVGSPFKKFVSTGELNEDLGLVPSRQQFLESVIEVIEGNGNVILPIIGEVGQGKTHLYWALKHTLHNYNTVYISLETVYKKFYYNTYSEFIENLGIEPEDSVEPLRYLTKRLCDEWGAQERKYGFFQIVNIDKIKKTALENWSNKFEKKEALMDAITAITTHQLDPFKKIDAERWLLGELMATRELSRLNLKNDLRKRDNAFVMLKILIENLRKESILFIDDFERIISIMNPIDDEAEEIFDPSWLYGNKQSPDKISAEKTFDKILELLSIKGLKIIITLKSLEYFGEIKKKIEEKNKNLLILVKNPLDMPSFTEEDVFQLYKEHLDLFFANIDYKEYSKHFSTSLFPINKKILKTIFSETQGNPREVIKHLIKIFNEIVISNEKLEDILKKHQ
ncbi:hypothetical protein LCGC14_1557620 [marine sediment metagenome]|uniref:Uncharacterized protein n=1 Tax=marine sediment metagenome TaxID=412755 RepID=A0A0F9INK0_9ZZZZ